MTRARRQHGFAYIAAIVFLVFLAGMALAVLRLQNTQQATIDANILGMRAGQAARGGVEWALYQLRTGDPANCNNVVNQRTLTDFVAATGFRVTLQCGVRTYQEGQAADGSSQAKNIFTVTATACNGAAATCPDNASAARASYVERQRSASFCAIQGGTDCY